MHSMTPLPYHLIRACAHRHIRLRHNLSKKRKNIMIDLHLLCSGSDDPQKGSMCLDISHVSNVRFLVKG